MPDASASAWGVPREDTRGGSDRSVHVVYADSGWGAPATGWGVPRSTDASASAWVVPREDVSPAQSSFAPSAPLPEWLVKRNERLARRLSRGGPGRRARRRARENDAVRVGPDGEFIYYDILDDDVEIPPRSSDEDSLDEIFS